MAALADHLGQAHPEFIQRYTRLRADRHGLALEVRSNGKCVFLEGGLCAVQPVKPRQCRDFPHLWNFPGFEKICHAIPQRVGTDDWRRLVANATQRAAESLTPPLDQQRILSVTSSPLAAPDLSRNAPQISPASAPLR